MTAESEGYGRGAEFTVQLPARITSIAQVTGHRASSAPPSLVDARRAPPRLDGLKLLVVDDEEDSRALVGEVLGALGAEVHVAGSVDEALLLFERVRPDVLVSDIGMPIVDGYALIKRVRALPPELGGQTPAVAVTAFARKEDAERAFAAGYQSHVAKPVEPAHLATIVANLGGRILE